MDTHPVLTYAIQYFDETGPMRAPYLICKGFLQAGWQVRILTMASDRNEDIDSVWQQVKVHKVNGISRRSKILMLMMQCLGRRKNEVVLTWIWDRHCFALMLSRILWGSPYVVVLDGYTHLAPWDLKHPLSKLVLELRYGLVLRKADLILADGQVPAEHARRHCKRARVLFAPGRFWQRDLQEVEDCWEREGHRLERMPIILYTGRIVKRKKLDNLIMAFARLADKYTTWSLELRGSPAERDYYHSLQQMVRSRGLEGRVEFADSLSGEWLYRRYRTTSIYCLPSTGEGIPTTIAEAMYFGGAIVAADSGSVSYQLDSGTCGLIYRPGDVDTLTDYLELLMSSERLRARYVDNARLRITELFMWDRYFSEIESIFRTLI